jgi:hypothetical protein
MVDLVRANRHSLAGVVAQTLVANGVQAAAPRPVPSARRALPIAAG